MDSINCKLNKGAILKNHRISEEKIVIQHSKIIRVIAEKSITVESDLIKKKRNITKYILILNQNRM